MEKVGNSKFYEFMTRNVKEFSRIKLVIMSFLIIGIGAFASYLITYSYAIFGTEVEGEKVIEVTVSTDNVK